MKQLKFCILVFALFSISCRSKGPHNAVWESKHHPSDDLRGDYKKAVDADTKASKNFKKAYQRHHRHIR